MTPEEKAEQLVDKFQRVCGSFGNGIAAAHICCDEVIAFMQDAVSVLCEDGGEILEPRQYWAQVKSHLKSL